MKQAALFPGQGSQIVGMGRAFFEASEQAKALFKRADEVLGFSLSKLCFEGPLEELTLTQNAQPAILVTSYVCFVHTDADFVAAAGHSLGEYTALVAAGVLSFEDAVLLVRKRGTYMQEAVPAGKGKMVAVMGPSEAEIREVIGAISTGIPESAHLNSPGEHVVAGDIAGVDGFSELMKTKGGKIIPLNVSAPFHCSLMRPAAEKLAGDLKSVTFNNSRFPVYANVTAAAVKNSDEARLLLEQQVCGSVRWTDSMQRLVEEQNIERVVEFGPGGVLSKLMKRITKQVGALEVSAPEHLATL